MFPRQIHYTLIIIPYNDETARSTLSGATMQQRYCINILCSLSNDDEDDDGTYQ